MKFISIQNIFIFTLGIFLFSCNSTKIVETYKADEAKSVDKIYIVGLTGQEMPEQKIEAEMVRRLEERGVRANSTRYDISSEIASNEEDLKSITDSISESDYDAILTFALVGVSEEKDIVTPALYDTPSGPIDYPYFNNYYSYYGYRAPLIYSKGYYESNTIFNLEASLYNLENGKLIWIGQTKTVEPFSVDEFAENYAKTIVDKLIYEDLVQR